MPSRYDGFIRVQVDPVHTTAPISSSTKPRPTKVGLAKVGIIGLGCRAKLLTRAAAGTDKIKIIAAHSRSEQKRRAFQLESRVPVVSDLRTLLSYPMLDGIILTVPPDQHLSLAVEVAKAKKHLYIECPIAGTLEQGLEIAALEQKYGITLTVGHGARFLPGIRKIREAIDAGELGTVGLIEANFSFPHDFGRAVAGPRAPSENALDASLLRLSVEQFDVLRSLGGEILDVSAMGARLSPAEADTDDQATALLRFAGGRLGYAGSSSTSPAVFAVRVFGSKGVMHYEADPAAWDTPEKLHENSAFYIQRRGVAYAQSENLRLPLGNMFRDELEVFAQACRTGKSTQLTAAAANAALAVAVAASHSARNASKSLRVVDILRRAQARL